MTTIVQDAIMIETLKKLSQYEPILKFSDDEWIDLNTQFKGFSNIDEIAGIISHNTQRHYKYEKLAGRLLAYRDNEFIKDKSLRSRLKNCDIKKKVHPDIIDLIAKNESLINNFVDYTRNYKYGYFGYITFMKTYSVKIDKNYIITPQDIFIVQALRFFPKNPSILYNILSNHQATFATPNIANCYSVKNQLSSCFFLSVNDDSIDGMYDTIVPDIAHISANSGGISLSLDKLRTNGSLIRGSGGLSTGLPPYLQMLEKVAGHVNQGSTRKGALAIYLSDWHGDFYDFIETGSKHKNASTSSNGLYRAVELSDLFLERARTNEKWSFFNPLNCPDLVGTHGAKFRELYEKYERLGLYVRQENALDVLNFLVDNMLEQGKIYLKFKDQVNKVTNCKNLGTVNSSNLCNEIDLFTGVFDGKTHTPVCVLSSISLPAFLSTISGVEKYTYDHKKLGEVVEVLVEALDNIISLQNYPTSRTEFTSKSTRAIGIGIQGLSDVCQLMQISHTCETAKNLNAHIQETMYYHAVQKSAQLAQERGSYDFFEGSDFSKGILHHDYYTCSSMYDWSELRETIKKGMRNQTLLANMPTSTTSQILDNVECFEAPTYNIYTRETYQGKFVVINKHLVNYLEQKGLWNDEMATWLTINNGSVQNLDSFNSVEKEIFRTAYEINQLDMIEIDAVRQSYVDQSQSSNRFFVNPTNMDIIKCIYKSRKLGLKSWYYTHRPPTKENFVPELVNLGTSNGIRNSSSKYIEDAEKTQKAESIDYEVKVCPVGCGSCGS